MNSGWQLGADGIWRREGCAFGIRVSDGAYRVHELAGAPDRLGRAFGAHCRLMTAIEHAEELAGVPRR